MLWFPEFHPQNLRAISGWRIKDRSVNGIQKSTKCDLLFQLRRATLQNNLLEIQVRHWVQKESKIQMFSLRSIWLIGSNVFAHYEKDKANITTKRRFHFSDPEWSEREGKSGQKMGKFVAILSSMKMGMKNCKWKWWTCFNNQHFDIFGFRGFSRNKCFLCGFKEKNVMKKKTVSPFSRSSFLGLLFNWHF